MLCCLSLSLHHSLHACNYLLRHRQLPVDTRRLPPDAYSTLVHVLRATHSNNAYKSLLIVMQTSTHCSQSPHSHAHICTHRPRTCNAASCVNGADSYLICPVLHCFHHHGSLGTGLCSSHGCSLLCCSHSHVHPPLITTLFCMQTSLLTGPPCQSNTQTRFSRLGRTEGISECQMFVHDIQDLIYTIQWGLASPAGKPVIIIAMAVAKR